MVELFEVCMLLVTVVDIGSETLTLVHTVEKAALLFQSGIFQIHVGSSSAISKLLATRRIQQFVYAAGGHLLSQTDKQVRRYYLHVLIVVHPKVES